MTVIMVMLSILKPLSRFDKVGTDKRRGFAKANITKAIARESQY